jgi:ligand-binding sensor domain-containing protein
MFIYSTSSGWCQPGQEIKLSGEPYVYTDWQSFTTESTQGKLINDHILFLKADGDSLWIGTEGGLVLYENGDWKSWTEKDGLP